MSSGKPPEAAQRTLSENAYQSLIDDLQKAHARTARFRRAAFHVHSVGSYDWGERGHASSERNARAKFEGDGGPNAFLNELVSAGIELVGITDHMRSGYACALAKAASKRSDITVFPGMEVNCRIKPFDSHRIHLLVLFPPDAKPDQIDRIFASQAGFPSEEDRDGQTAEASIDDFGVFATQVRTAGGMIIVAHVDDRQRGLRTLFRTEREQSLGAILAESPDEGSSRQHTGIPNEFRTYLQAIAPDAIELQRVGDQQFYGDSVILGEAVAATPCVMRTDHHCVEDFAREDRLTHVKVSEPTFEAVRRALQFHRTRIRFSDDLPEHPTPRIVGMRLRSPDKTGLFEDLTLAFNGNLNCLIGPRGSGKSTVLEALRFSLGRNDHLEQIDYGSDAISPADLALNIQNANLDGTLIEVAYETGPGSIWILQAAFETGEFTTRVFSADGTDQDLDRAAVLSTFPVRIYSWGELETLGRKASRQRDLVDRLIPELVDLDHEAASIGRELAENRMAAVGLAKSLERRLAGSALSGYREAKATYERLNTDEAAALFAALDLAREKLLILDQVDQAVGSTRAQLEALRGAPSLGEANRIVEASSSTELEGWARELSAELGIKVFRDDLNDAIDSFEARLEAVDGDSVARREDAQREHARIEAELREQTQTDAEQAVRRDQRESARRRFETAEAEREQYVREAEDLKRVLSVRDELIQRMTEVRSKVSAARTSSSERLAHELRDGAEGMDVTIEVVELGDRAVFRNYVEEDVLHRSFAGRYREQKVAARLCAAVTPEAFAAALRTGDGSAIEATLGAEQTKIDVERIIDALGVPTRHDGAGVEGWDAARLEQALVFDELAISDEVKILLEGRPVDELSPGQRAGAMLPLVALSESSPLLIDQPEDNLDNRLVGKTLTSILAKLKERRQIIVATHNPNIVVGGDAEQVAVLNSAADHEAQLECAASIDDDEVIAQVLAIMEGGKAAFDDRAKRYGRSQGSAAA